MKKQTALTMALLIALAGLAACSAKRERQSENEIIEKYNETELDEFAENSQSTVKSVTFIGEEKAKELAAARAGVAVATIDFKKIELDEDDGVWKYETNFSHNGTLYQAEINAENGEIIEWKIDEEE